MWKKLAQLCDTDGPSGYETAATEVAAALLVPYVKEVKTDALGNLFGYLPCGKENAKLLALDAHLDEIGVLITGHKDGFARIMPIGGIDPRIMPARDVRLLNGLHGVVAHLPPHLSSSEDLEKYIPFDELYLDLGLSQEEAIHQAPVGTVGVFEGAFEDLGESVMGKALDDRACFVMILRALELLKKPLNVDIVVIGTVQEELGHRGAITAAYGQAPDFAIAIDVSHAHTPDVSKDKTFAAGEGPAILLGPAYTRSMTDKLIAVAKEKNIPYQIDVSGGRSGTDTWEYPTTKEGIPAALIALPLKYMHTPSEMLRKDDFENGAKLLAAYVEAL